MRRSRTPKEHIGPIDPDASTLNQILHSEFRHSANAHDRSEEGIHLPALLRLRTVRVRATEYDPENAALDDMDHGGVARRTVGHSAATDKVFTSILPVRTDGAGGYWNGLTSVRLVSRRSSKELEVDVCPPVVAAGIGSTKTGESGALLFRR